jgi:RimJ/RimL family protein N-acetyltransferase
VHVKLDGYPAHLHINVEAAWRGNRLGERLIKAYLSQLRYLGIPGVHLETTSLNAAACRLYEKTGFRLLEGVQTRLWSHLGHTEVELRCYGQKLPNTSP